MLIIATIEKYLFTEERIRKLILAGADTIRFNFSYRTIEENIECITALEQIVEELHSHTKILIDFPINKIRLGDFDLKLFSVNEGDALVFRSGAFSFDCYDYVPVQIANLGEKLKIGQSITIGDGEVSVQVTEIIDKDSVKVHVQNKGVIQYMKTFNIPTNIPDDQMTEIYSGIIEKLKHTNASCFAISYFNQKSLKRNIDLIQQSKLDVKIILKIENELSTNELEEICKEKNIKGLLIDRGELGVNMPYYKLGIYQKQIIKIAKEHKKPVIVSTQVLESTMNNYIPSRAEIMDITTSVLDGASGILLCRETVMGSRPAYVVSVAKKIIEEAEKHREK